MSRKAIYLMGAPSGRLQWDEKELLDTAVPPFGFVDAAYSTPDRKDATKWRVLKRTINARVSPSQWAANTLFLDTSSLITRVPLDISEDILLSQFYEHSLSILEASSSETDNNDTTLASEDSNIDESIDSVTGSGAIIFPYPCELHDVKNIPNAAYLRSIIPQTPSVTLVVAVIGINPIRRVTTRQSKQELDILEIIVGDETRTGFSITFWLTVPKHTRENAFRNSNSDLRDKLCGLRLRDIVLIRNLGLSSFQDLVYGQSLRKGVTKVDLLHREQLNDSEVHGAFSSASIDAASREDRLLCKVQNVRDWLMNFVGAKKYQSGHKHEQPLPPDTQ